jgi:hypothetical protein
MEDYVIRILQLSKEGLSCSQILMQLALEARGESNSALVRSMGALAYGYGHGKGHCGVLTAACCALALHTDNGSSPDTQSERLPLMLQELNDWFDERVTTRFGGITCESIVGKEGPQASRQKCGAILMETYAKILSILEAHGVVVSPTAG